MTENYCWSCQQQLHNGISIDESEDKHVCGSCWTKIPIRDRIELGLLFRSKEKGGYGLRQKIHMDIMELIQKSETN